MITSVGAGRFHGIAVSYGSQDVYTWGVGAGEAAESLIEVGRKQSCPAPGHEPSIEVNGAQDVILGLSPAASVNGGKEGAGNDNRASPSGQQQTKYNPYEWMNEPKPKPKAPEAPTKPLWLPTMDPSITSLVSRLPLPAAKVMPRPPTLGALLSKLPLSLRRALCSLDVDGEELAEGEGGKESKIAQGSTGMTLLRMRMTAPVAMVTCGAEHSLASLVGGCILAWGCNRRGQCGISTHLGKDKIDYPVLISQLIGIRAISISGGEEHR